jgi:hypothetical protein
MQVLRGASETAECCPRPMSSGTATPATVDTTPEASPTLPAWGTLPPARRRRVVAVLGAIVQRTRREGLDER